MQFKSHTIRGHGRGKSLGFPTLNLEIRDDIAFSLPDGIYASWAWIGEKKYPAALYIGPVPVFGQKDKSLELYILDEFMLYVGEGEEVAFEPIRHIRNVMDFSSPELLVLQMEKDVQAVRSVLESQKR